MPPRVPHPVPRHPPGLGAARPGPARPRPAPRQRGRAAGRPRRGGAGLGGGGRPGGTRACRHVQTRAGTRPPASTCRHTCERTHTCAKCARAAVQTQTRTCKCRLGQGPHSAGKCTHTPVSKQARTGARTCTQRANAHAPHPLPRTRLAPARRAQMQPSPLPNARRALTPIVRVHRCTHALPTRPCDTRTAVPSTSLHVPPHPVPPPRTPAVPRPCHPGATRWAHPGAAAGSRARGGGGAGGGRAQLRPRCLARAQAAANKIPALPPIFQPLLPRIASAERCRQRLCRGGRGGTLPGPPRSRPGGSGWVLAALHEDEDAASRVAALQDFARGAAGREAGPGRAQHSSPSPAVAVPTHPSPGHPCAGPRPGDVPCLQQQDVVRWQPAAGASSSAGPASSGPTCRSHQASQGRGRVPEKQRQSCQGRAGPEGGCHVAAAPPRPAPAPA